MLSRLERYIRSSGQIIPFDYKEFRETGLCLFCGVQLTSEELSENIVYRHYKSSDTPEHTGCQCCSSCMDRVEMMEQILQDKDLKFQKALFDETMTRIENYLFSGAVDSNAFRYFSKLNNNTCYFCRQIVKAYCTTYPTKVDTNRYGVLTGGDIMSCKECRDKIEDYIEENYPDEESYSTYITSLWLRTNCTSCGRNYFLTQDEYIRREKVGDLERYYCFNCTIKKIRSLDTFKEYQLLFGSTQSNLDSLRRASYVPCAFCGDPEELDLMYNWELYKQRSITYLNGNNKYCCCNCKLDDKFPAATLLHLNQGKHIHNLYKKEHYYVMTVRQSRAPYSVLKCVTLQEEDILDATTKMVLEDDKERLW